MLLHGMKPRMEFIIMKIFMNIVKICPKSPRFTVLKFIVHWDIIQPTLLFISQIITLVKLSKVSLLYFCLFNPYKSKLFVQSQ